ncbi:hypothetical protein [Terribacillus sp. DMT04]|uniref:hypothetical protein n=1 Tax=Terribacillus sp. DMT04 TaxID=2850441 RepID=UPI001C2BF9F1|nr:hypothetical protein [Terribacillus sp. DMT04]QXE02857.1 hypothetical protein KS242_06670 [Terribacillus sp. DMT04]
MGNNCFSSTLCWLEPVEQVVRQDASDQLQGIEIWAQHVFFHDSNPLVIRKTKPGGTQFTMHASSWYLPITSIDCSIRTASVNSMILSIELAVKLNTNFIAIYSGYKSLAKYYSSIHQHLQAKEHVI